MTTDEKAESELPAELPASQNGTHPPTEPLPIVVAQLKPENVQMPVLIRPGSEPVQLPNGDVVAQPIVLFQLAGLPIIFCATTENAYRLAKGFKKAAMGGLVVPGGGGGLIIPGGAG